MNETLFPLPDATATAARGMDEAAPRVQRPNRRQLEWRPMDLEALLPEDHRARVVWDFVEGVDLTPLYGAIKAVEGHAGRPAIDPAILLGLWLYATLEGVGSARALERLCEAHDGYRWMCGGVSVNYHTLAEFRVEHPEVLDGLLTTSVAALMAEGLVDLRRVAQDGVKVRASAGKGSFRRAERLQELLAEATAHVARLREQVATDPGGASRREAAARARAAAARQQRVTAALEQLPELEQRRRRAGVKGPARTSTTDPDARVMKMPDGGFRPAFNAQVMTTTREQIIVGVEVTNGGTDQGQLQPMVGQAQRRYGQGPQELLADGGYVDLEDLRQVAAQGCTVYAPPPGFDDPTRASRPRWRVDDAVVGEWRQRMGTAAGQQVYRERAATSECVNALARNRGWRQVVVRGQARVRTVLLWFALAHNLWRAAGLRAALAATP
jgi:transposase